MNDKFIEASKRERFCLLNILPQIKSKKYDWCDYLTDVYSYDEYDCLLQASIDGAIKKRFIIEIKLRDVHYNELILETKKLRSLKSKVYDDRTSILYINVTPKGTYIFNLTELEKNNKLVVNKIKANKATMSSREHKVDKNVIFLDINDAKKLEYVYLEKDFNQSLKQINKVNNDSKNKKDLFTYLLFPKEID